ncbi:copper chaperone PCu(A)C [Pseudoduganella violacea]|uniref:Copper chaperone PCu(A)C n=1 Tax=Pseudoduganella violacea TaxID=1715466 RepID=A0A7W5B8K7_9BURK|nr:copper chaperone PCu(A)C [Pseudoduganella violacea]MBB3118524.1 hypothetical protein [Pseudoduganella violacea]
MKKQFFACAISMAFAASAMAQVTVSESWARATVPAAKASGAFMLLQSAQDARLVGVETTVANAELHQMSMENNVMKMSEIDGLDLPAGKAVELKPGSYHVMLMQLKRQLKEGDTVPLKLTFEKKDKKRETVEVQVPVKPINYSPSARAHAGH